MKKTDGTLGEPTHLRRRAEERLSATEPDAFPSRTGKEAHRLLHELQVHQIELEMQNAELRQARDEVETALEKYTDLYDFAPVGYFTLARDTGIVAVNLAGAGLLGLERSHLINRRFEQFVADDSRSPFTAFLGKVFARKAKLACEIALLKEGTQQFFVQIEALACTSGDECRVAIFDITQRRRAEDALAEKRRELEDLNRSLETRIVQAVDELRRKDQLLILQERRAVMGEMINNIAHQWRQPLNSLSLYIQDLRLESGSGELSGRNLEDTVGKCMQLIMHMSQTIQDFRDFFKPDKEKVLFGVNRVIGHALSLIDASLKEPKISIDLHTEGDPAVNGYPNEYAQVLLNILSNARDALAGRNVYDARITIQAFTEGDTAVVTITDNAGGIPEEVVEKMFNPYFTTKGADKGTGVGLFMSKTIIEKNMGGRLTVRNTGRGAEFRIEV
jgi:signal transduction histidine kinase/PAS domain-containing protein